MSTDIDDRLRDAHARIDPGPAPDATRARLDALIAGSASPSANARPIRSAPSRSRRGALAVLAASLTVAAIAVLALLPGSRGVSGPESASAACAPPGPAQACGAALRDVASAWDVTGSGDILYRRGSSSVTQVTVTATPSNRADASGAPAPNEVVLPAAEQPFVVARTGFEELWIAPDGSGRTSHSRRGDVTLSTTRDREAWEAAGRPDLEKLIPRPSTAGPQSSDFGSGRADKLLLGANGLYDVLAHDGDPLSVIPRQPARLAAWLEEQARKRRVSPGQDPRAAQRLIDDTVVSDIETLLAYPATPPELRATLVSVLTERPGTRSLGLIRDPGGREVAAVMLARGMHDGDGANVVAFDPASGELRGIGRATSGDGVRWSRTFAIVSERVGAIGETP